MDFAVSHKWEPSAKHRGQACSREPDTERTPTGTEKAVSDLDALIALQKAGLK